MQANLPVVSISEQHVALIRTAYDFERVSVPVFKKELWDGEPAAHVVWNTDRGGEQMRFPLDVRSVHPNFWSRTDEREFRVVYIGPPSECPYAAELGRMRAEYPAQRICIVERVPLAFEELPFRLLFRMHPYRTPEEIAPVGPESYVVSPFS